MYIVHTIIHISVMKEISMYVCSDTVESLYMRVAHFFL